MERVQHVNVPYPVEQVVTQTCPVPVEQIVTKDIEVPVPVQRKAWTTLRTLEPHRTPRSASIVYAPLECVCTFFLCLCIGEW